MGKGRSVACPPVFMLKFCGITTQGEIHVRTFQVAFDQT
jgi:hypothetical protein